MVWCPCPAGHCAAAVVQRLYPHSERALHTRGSAAVAAAAAAATLEMPHFHTAPNAVSVVVGASRGLGLALSAALLQRSTGRVVALARQPEEAPALMALQEASGGRLSCFSCDVTDYESLRAMAKHVKAEHEQIDLLLNVAGILHEPAGGGRMDAVRQPERRLAAVDPGWMARVYAVNAMGPVLTTQAVQPLLSKGAVIASLSARVGSISDNRMGGWWSYRMSKSALNMGAHPPPSGTMPCANTTATTTTTTCADCGCMRARRARSHQEYGERDEARPGDRGGAPSRDDGHRPLGAVPEER